MIQTFVRDDAKKIIWGAQSPEPMDHDSARDYCLKRNDLGKIWRLPEPIEFSSAGTTDVHHGVAERLFDQRASWMGMTGKSYWTSSMSLNLSSGGKRQFHGFSVDGVFRPSWGKKLHVRCVVSDN